MIEQKRTDISSILMLSSRLVEGPDTIPTHLPELEDFKSHGYRIILVSADLGIRSAQDHADDDFFHADSTYVSPLTHGRITEIIEKERPDAILVNPRDSAAVSCVEILRREGILDRFGVEAINDRLESVDSTSWTGPKFIYLDAEVLKRIRSTAFEVYRIATELNYRSERERDDVLGLCQALVALCQMAEPELSLIDQIASNPKLKIYGSLLVGLATIRSALGI